MGRCREFKSTKGFFGIFLLFILDLLSFWLSASILLSWVMTSKYFFPVPSLSIKPGQLLTPAGGDAGAFGNFGINVGPMLISWALRYVKGRVEMFIGKAMSDAFKFQQKMERKKVRKEERAKEKEERRAARKVEKEVDEERIKAKEVRRAARRAEKEVETQQRGGDDEVLIEDKREIGRASVFYI